MIHRRTCALVLALLALTAGAQDDVTGCSVEWREGDSTYLCAIECPDAAVCHVEDCHCRVGQPALATQLEIRARPHAEVAGLYWLEVIVRDEEERAVASPRIMIPAGQRAVVQSIDGLQQAVLLLAAEIEPGAEDVSYELTAWTRDAQPAVIAQGTVPLAAQ